MRELALNEISMVAGAEDHNVVVVDPVAAVQTFLYIISVTDRDSFVYGSVVTGMLAGAGVGGYMGYGALAATSGVAAGVAGALGGAAVGCIAGGFALKAGAMFGVGAYNFIMG